MNLIDVMQNNVEIAHFELLLTLTDTCQLWVLVAIMQIFTLKHITTISNLAFTTTLALTIDQTILFR